VFLHQLVTAAPRQPRPLVVFIHGTNAQLIKYRWMGGGREGDVRRIVAEMMESQTIEPVIVAGPSSVEPAAIVNARTSWPSFDLADFVDRLERSLGGLATIDRTRIIVVGHSGGGCNPKGGIATAARGPLAPLAAIAVDTCMDPEVGIELARARPETRVIVTWQTQGWLRRPFDLFVKAFRRECEGDGHGPAAGRVLDHLRVTEPMPHDAMVPLTLRKWLPLLLAPARRAGTGQPDAASPATPPRAEPGP
jgi:pimeloyl-ACP methyl ester carboxylesterase